MRIKNEVIQLVRIRAPEVVVCLPKKAVNVTVSTNVQHLFLIQMLSCFIKTKKISLFFGGSSFKTTKRDNFQ